MRYRQSTVGTLEKVSTRLGFGLLITLLLLVFFMVAGYWVSNKVIRGEVLKVDYHFMRLVGRAHDHEIFLLRAIKASRQMEYQSVFNPAAYVFAQTRTAGVRIYEGGASQFGTRFSAALPEAAAKPGNAVLTQQLRLAIALANVYSDFWSGSPYLAPQIFLFDLDSAYEIAVPSIKAHGATDSPDAPNFVDVLKAVKTAARELPARSSDLIVHWRPSGRFFGKGEMEQILGYVSDSVADEDWRANGPPRELIAASLLQWDEFDSYGLRIEKQVFDIPLFESIDIVAPDGTWLVGVPTAQFDAYESGFHLTANGLVVKRSAGAQGAWQALYHISYERLAFDARWQLVSLIGLLALCVLIGWSVIVWYRRRIVVPASSDYRELLINHDFNHSLLQTVPLALCVVNGPDLQRVIENSLYAQWLGEAGDLGALMEFWPTYEGTTPIAGEGCLMVGARALHARYTPTEYQDQSMLLCTFTDISSHREASASLVFARNAADAASEQKSNFVATLSHEIRTPLYGVLGTLELLNLTPLSEQQAAYLHTIDNSSAALLHLISDVLDLSKIGAGQLLLEPVTFRPLEMLEETVRGFSGMATNKGLSVFCCVDPRVPTEVMGDRFRIHQIVSNLLNNALKFTQRGHVAVMLSVSPATAARVRLQWTVVDTGPGMSRSVQDRLFERFYQADNKQHTLAGTGLGLPICVSLSQMMGGELTVNSEIGKGSEFTLALTLDTPDLTRTFMPLPALHDACIDVQTPFPELTDNLCRWLEVYGTQTSVMGDFSCGVPDVVVQVMPLQLEGASSGYPTVFAQDDLNRVPILIGQDVLVNRHSIEAMLLGLSCAITGKQPELIEPTAEAGRLHLGLRVLLAEDSPVNQALMKEQLENFGCTVDVAGDGLKALEYLNRQAYDILLTDVNMPNMDGYALAEVVRQRDLDMPIIGVTANALREEGEHCIRVGMNSWLTKPIDIQGLYLSIRAVLGQRSLPAASTLSRWDDKVLVPERMQALFLETLAQDLGGLKTALTNGQGLQVIDLLHRVRGALAVARAKSLIVACRELEVKVTAQGLRAHLGETLEFVERVELAVQRL